MKTMPSYIASGRNHVCVKFKLDPSLRALATQSKAIDNWKSELDCVANARKDGILYELKLILSLTISPWLLHAITIALYIELIRLSVVLRWNQHAKIPRHMVS